MKKRITELVSVPLRGLWFLSFDALMNIQEFEWPSFRPLAGIMVLITRDYDDAIEAGESVSVPLRGLWFLSDKGF